MNLIQTVAAAYWESPMAGMALPFLALILGQIYVLVTGNALITRLKELKGMKWSPREDTPGTHQAKAGVPSMGGIGIVGCALLVYLLLMSLSGPNSLGSTHRWSALLGPTLVFPLIVALHMGLGLVDDLSKAKRLGGISSRQKLLGQLILASVFVLVCFWPITAAPSSGWMGNPGGLSPLAALAWAVFLILVLVGTSNAVNLTDGIDGLAASTFAQSALFLGVAATAQHSWGSLAFWPDVAAVRLMLFCLAGACVGFLTFNRHPAKIFMGDTGSLALGAALGAGAILTGTVLLLPFVGLVFYLETASVMLQVAYFKYTKRKTGEGKRIFRRAPLHHHFELGGWSEKRVVATFWLVNMLSGLLGLYLWFTGLLPRLP